MTLTTQDIETLASLLNRLPMSPAEVAWARLFTALLHDLTQATVNTPNAKKGENDDNG